MDLLLKNCPPANIKGLIEAARCVLRGDEISEPQKNIIAIFASGAEVAYRDPQSKVILTEGVDYAISTLETVTLPEFDYSKYKPPMDWFKLLEFAKDKGDHR